MKKITQKLSMDREHHKIAVRDLNSVITCRLCEGYFVDATTLVDCLHAFCRACILRHFENNKTGCPSCNTVYKKKSQSCFRADPQIQSLVYKLVPSLYAKEMQRREDFYRSTRRAYSSCSDDSVIDRERDMINDQEEMISAYVGDKNQFFGPDDSISLSLEYYQVHLDTFDDAPKASSVTDGSVLDLKRDGERQTNLKSENVDLTAVDKEVANSNKVTDCTGIEAHKECDKRFLQCPAAVSMKHLQKFIRMKFGLTGDHRVDIIYRGEVLPVNFSLMDVAYSFKWSRTKPMRFFYRIFTPMKVRPIKIINTTLSTGGKQLQIVPVKPNAEPHPENIVGETTKTDDRLEETEDRRNHKEQLFAHLQLQSRVQVDKQSKKVPDKAPAKDDGVYEYVEPDQEEIKRFAEKRDREWALQKKLDESRKDEDGGHHFSKKRKKSKHSKSENNLHKKRKLHAEIASNEEDLKLKVKITNNGHKHKHHKSSSQTSEKTQDISSKEKLLQMRQVRHKHMPSEDKIVQTVNIEPSKDPSTASTEKTQLKNQDITEDANEPKKDVAKLKIKIPEASTKVSESAALPQQQSQDSTSPKVGAFLEQSSSKQSIPKKSGEKEWGKKVPTVQLERFEQAEKQAQKTFLKTFQTYAEKYHKNEQIQQKKLENAKKLKLNINTPPDVNKINTNNKNLDIKIANLQQHCTIEAKQPEKVEKKVTFTDKPKLIAPHYPAGFTVSKIEQGVKRKADDNIKVQDKRPSLEITLINPPAQQTPKLAEKPAAKRPMPATIPLDIIKKSVNLKSGISIIPKLPDMCDNIGALDLSSKTSKSPEVAPKTAKPETNGFGLASRQLNALSRAAPPEKNNMALSNLQMLSKVATEHSSMNKAKQKPQMPSLQTLKVPALLQKSSGPNMQKLPKLNEIQKFRPTNPPRNLRPNQNQNIRNIPNPSLLIRQQNQNRLNSQIANAQHGNSDAKAMQNAAPIAVVKETATVTPIKTIPMMENKLQEKQEISV